ncbi:MAG: S8 family serine peptidase [Planctomycetota bacterium]|jgi:subtilisin family serine protease
MMQMRRSLTRLTSAAIVTILAFGTPVDGDEVDPAVTGQAVIRVHVGSSIGAAIAQLEAELPEVTFAIDDVSLADRRIYLLDFEPVESADDVEEALESLEDIPGNPIADWGELLYEGHAPEGHTGSIWFRSVGGEQEYAEQYASEMLRLPLAQEHSTGQGVVVAVLDTGIDAHPVLAGRIAPGGYNFVTSSADTADVGDELDNDGDGLIDESVGHGTFVAGLIHLVAPDAMLLPIVVLNSDGVGDAWSFAQGMFYAIDQGVEVINLSLGSTKESDVVEVALEEARALGVVVVAAAGNLPQEEPPEGDPNLAEFPAAVEDDEDRASFGVAALDDSDIKAGFSKYHEEFFISAPGTSVRKPDAPDGFDPDRTIYSTVPGGEYGIWMGTSLSTAFVSGATALVRARHPEWPARQSTHHLMATTLARTAVPIDDLDGNDDTDWEDKLGAGRLDVGAAVLHRPGDLNLDGQVGIPDLLELLAAWGPCDDDDDGDECWADLDGDGTVGVPDLLILVRDWG